MDICYRIIKAKILLFKKKLNISKKYYITLIIKVKVLWFKRNLDTMNSRVNHFEI